MCIIVKIKISIYDKLISSIINVNLKRYLLNPDFNFYTQKVLILLTFVFCYRDIYAFEGYEHRQLSNHAFQIAINYVCSKNTKNTKNTKNRLKESICPSPEAMLLIEDIAEKNIVENPNKVFSYGQVTELVDSMHYPRQIFEYSSDDEEYNGYPKNKKDLNQHVLNLTPSGFFDPSNLNLFDASNQNQRHFQAALLESMNTLHKQAMTEALGNHKFSALVTNALSDHYLHDFFAPGHIITGRENSHDAVALAQHDKENLKGTCFKIVDKNRAELTDIIAFIEKIQKEKKPKKLQLLIRHNKNIKADKIKSIINKNAKKCGIKVWEGNDLGKMLQDFNKFKPNEQLLDEEPFEQLLDQLLGTALYHQLFGIDQLLYKEQLLVKEQFEKLLEDIKSLAKVQFEKLLENEQAIDKAESTIDKEQ